MFITRASETLLRFFGSQKARRERKGGYMIRHMGAVMSADKSKDQSMAEIVERTEGRYLLSHQQCQWYSCQMNSYKVMVNSN